MTRTTPPRPVDIATVFPELAKFSRTTTRLHPRPGTPTPYESSVGGPLLWPLNDPWPYCEGPHEPDWGAWGPFTSLADLQHQRQLMTIYWNQIETISDFLTAEQKALIEDLQRKRNQHDWTNEPIAMLPVAQLYARDIPDLHPPAGCDLLQVLWCPFDHPQENMPKEKLVWRSSSTITHLLTAPPHPVAVEIGHYVPYPCILHPEQVIEYPGNAVLDEDLSERLAQWGKRAKVWTRKTWDGHAWVEIEDPDMGSSYYQYELSVAPGWKVGGWAPLSFRDVWPVNCTTCNADMEPLLTISSGEGNDSWFPLEDQAIFDDPRLRHYRDPGVYIGRGYNMQIYRCPVSLDHGYQAWMQ